MLFIQSVLYENEPITKCYLSESYQYKMLPRPNAIYTKCFLYQMLPRQIVLYENEPITKNYYTEMYYINCY